MRPEKSRKQCSFRHIKNSASMYESSDSQFFKTTTGVQLRPGAWWVKVCCDLFKQFESYRNMQFQISSRGGRVDVPLLRTLLAILKIPKSPVSRKL